MDAFDSLADILSLADTLQPAVSHPSTFPDWRETFEGVLADTIHSGEVALTRKEEERMEEAKEVAVSLLEKFLVRATAVGWAEQTPEERRAAVDRILARPQVPQRTLEWYAQGKQVLTASEFATIFASPRTRGQMVLSKAAGLAPGADAAMLTNRLACMTCEMGPFDWGVRFEPVVKQVLETRWGVQIAEAGRLLHPADPRLAASPDGLIREAEDPARVGRLLEIKCPISRPIGNGVPFEYWCQMQIQMEVTGIGECEYVEVKLQSIQKHETELPGGATPDGHVWLVQDPHTAQMAYVYTEEEKAAKELAGWDIVETIPWRVAAMWTKTVARDRAWFAGTAETRAAFWSDVEAARGGGFSLPESTRAKRAPAPAAGSKVIVHKEGATPPTACLFLDDEPAAAPPVEPGPAADGTAAPPPSPSPESAAAWRGVEDSDGGGATA